MNDEWVTLKVCLFRGKSEKKSIIEEEEDGIEVKSEGKVKKSQICHQNPPIDRVIEPEHSVQRDLSYLIMILQHFKTCRQR